MSTSLSIHDTRSIDVRYDAHNGTSWTRILIRAHNNDLFEIDVFDRSGSERAGLSIADNARPAEWNALPVALVKVLADIEEYLDDRADCDQPSGSAPLANEEMVLLCRLRKARKASKT